MLFPCHPLPGPLRPRLVNQSRIRHADVSSLSSLTRVVRRPSALASFAWRSRPRWPLGLRRLSRATAPRPSIGRAAGKQHHRCLWRGVVLAAQGARQVAGTSASQLKRKASFGMEHQKEHGREARPPAHHNSQKSTHFGRFVTIGQDLGGEAGCQISCLEQPA